MSNNVQTSTSSETTPDFRSEFGLARLLRDVRNAGAEPTHRFPDIEFLYDQLIEPVTETPTAGNVIQFPSNRRS